MTSAASEELAAAALAVLGRRGDTLATAESLTGGLLGATITAVAGASAVFRGGVIAYATELKADLLGVPGELLARRGPVDGDVAAAMALGARARLAVTVAVGLTGVAGPEPQNARPPGTVFVAVATAAGAVVRQLALTGDRAGVRAGAVRAALELLLTEIGGASEART